jgi:death-on-curing protein
LQSFALNHGFIDGNKRVAFATCAVFSRTNGYRLKVGADAAERFLIKEVIVARVALDKIADWLEKHMIAQNKRS